MKIIAKTKIQCGASRHDVSIADDGTVRCTCADGIERGEAIAGQLMLGAPGGVRGCAGLVALVHGAPSLARELRGSKEPQYGTWKPLVEQYRTNPVFEAALDLAMASRDELHTRVRAAVERVDFEHGLGKRQFGRLLRLMWDVPVTELTKFVVASFNDDRWEIPYSPEWTKLDEEGATVIDGRFVCGRGEDGTVYAITKHPDDEAWWVMPHKLDGGRLVELSA